MYYSKNEIFNNQKSIGCIKSNQFWITLKIIDIGLWCAYNLTWCFKLLHQYQYMNLWVFKRCIGCVCRIKLECLYPTVFVEYFLESFLAVQFVHIASQYSARTNVQKFIEKYVTVQSTKSRKFINTLFDSFLRLILDIR